MTSTSIKEYRTMKWLSICVAGLMYLSATTVSAQQVSPLQYLVTSNTQINRPEVFRNMQQGVEQEWGKLDKGTRLEILDKKMSKLRDNVLSVFNDVEAIVETNGAVTIKFAEQTYPLPLNTVSLTESFEQINGAFGSKFRNIFDVAIGNATFGSKNLSPRLYEQALFAALLIALDKVEQGETGSIPERIAKILVDDYQRILREEIQEIDPLFNFSDPDAWRMLLLARPQVKERLTKIVSGKVKEASTHARQVVSTAFDDAEDRLRTAIDQFNTWLVSANAGFGLSEGEGDLAGGLHISYTQSANMQIGAYVNGNLDPSATTGSAGAVGAQLRLSDDRWEISALVSGLRGDTWGIEAGLGGAVRVGGRTLVGLGYFVIDGTVQVDGQNLNGWSLAATIKGLSAGSPQILLGLSVRNGKTNPLFQISYPITASSE